MLAQEMAVSVDEEKVQLFESKIIKVENYCSLQLQVGWVRLRGTSLPSHGISVGMFIFSIRMPEAAGHPASVVIPLWEKLRLG